MIRATPTGFSVGASGPVVYLDNWALIELAEEDPKRRRRFIDAVHSGVDVLFSITNAAELSGPQGRSADTLKAFLNDIGTHWFPARMDPTEVVKREANGEDPQSACIDETFVKRYLVSQMRSYTPAFGKVMELSDSLFHLGAILDWVGPQRESIFQTSVEFDEMLRNKMSAARERCKRDPTLLDKKFPRIPFDAARRAYFVYVNLLRVMTVEANSLKKGDGMDFCHTVIACAFSGFAALDTQWKRQIGTLPPNPLACVYSPRELNQMVTDMESWLLGNRATWCAGYLDYNS
jgi:hypothetical protein